MKAAEPRYQKAWDELQHFEKSLRRTIPMTSGGLEKQLGAVQAQLEATRQQIHKFIKDTKAYRRWKAAVDRQELRAQWVLEQIPLIETALPEDNKAIKNSLSAKSGKKRKTGNDRDALSPQDSKRTRQGVGSSDSTPDPEHETEKEI